MKKDIKNDQPKKAPFPKKLFALILDAIILYLATFAAIDILAKEVSLESVSEIVKQGVLGLYFIFILVIIPQTIFSQTIGKFLIGLKVVSKDEYKRLSFSQTLTYSLLCGLWSESVVVDIR